MAVYLYNIKLITMKRIITVLAVLFATTLSVFAAGNEETIEIKIGRTKVALRVSEAKQIEVEKC